MQLLDIVTKDSTDRSVVIRIIDSTTGLPETAVEHNTSGIDLWYRREGAAKTSITEAALASLTTAHTDGGIEAIGDGAYRLDLPDAAFATGANYVDVGGTVTGMIVIGGRVRLVDFDLESATVDVGLWKGSAPADLSNTNKVPVSVQHWSLAGITTDITGSIGSVTGAVGSVTGNVGGNVTGSVGSVTGAVGSVTGNVTVGTIVTDAITAASLSAAAVAKIEAALMNEGDGQALIDAIVQAIDAADIENDVLPALIRDAILNRQLAGNHDTAGTVGKILQDILEDAGTTIPGAIALLATAEKLLAYVQLLARSDLGIGTDRSTELAEINNDEGSGAGDYGVSQSSQEGIAAAASTINVLIGNVQSRIPSALVGGRINATVDGTGMTTAAASVVKTAMEEDGSKLDHLWETTEDDGGNRRFTSNALELAPSGGGGGGGGGSVEIDSFSNSALDQLAGKVAIYPQSLINSVTQDITLRRGDDYYQDDGLGLEFTFVTGEVLWPTDLTDHTVVFAYETDNGKVTVTGAVDTATGSSRKVHVDVPGSKIPVSGEFKWELVLIHPSNGRSYTPRSGRLTISDDIYA